MTATEELRRLLDERGAEYTTDDRCREFFWDTGKSGTVRASAIGTNGLVQMIVTRITPEQAVEATLGNGTCHVESVARNEYGYAPQVSDYTFELSCGHSVTWDEQPDYCPWCGRMVIE